MGPIVQTQAEQQLRPWALLIWPCKMQGHRGTGSRSPQVVRSPPYVHEPGSAQKSVQSFLDLIAAVRVRLATSATRGIKATQRTK